MVTPAAVMTPDEIAARLSMVSDGLHVTLDEYTAGQISATSHPVVRVEPTTESQVASILKLASEYHWHLYPMGGGTHSESGNLLDRVDVILSLRRLTRLINYSQGDMVVTAEAGMPLQELQGVLAEGGQMLPIDPVCHPNASIGGLLSVNASGPLRSMYGTLRDFTIGLRTVYADGTVVRAGGKVVKNVAGYDLTKLFIGAYGTLAVLTEVTFKLRPLPPHREVVLLSGTSLQVERLRSRIMNSTLLPSQMEAVTGYETGLWSIAVGCHENRASARYQRDALRSLAVDLGMTVVVRSESLETSFWHDYRESLQAFPITLSFSAEPNQLIHLADELTSQLETAGLTTQMSLTLNVGVGHAYVDGPASLLGPVLQHVRTRAEAQGGRVSLKKGPPELRRNVDSYGSPGPLQPLLTAIKQTVDPNQLLAKGHFVGGI